jgi:hypothetical protein
MLLKPMAHNTEPFCSQRRGRFYHTLLASWRAAKHRARLRLLRFWAALCIWKTAFRSSYGHTEFERAREYGPLLLGHDFRVLPCGRLAPHERTEACSTGIRNLKATFGDWLPRFYRQIFLTGFEAGEQFVLRMGSRDYIESYLAPARGGNSMPSLATQQSTKRDGGVSVRRNLCKQRFHSLTVVHAHSKLHPFDPARPAGRAFVPSPSL